MRIFSLQDLLLSFHVVLFLLIFNSVQNDIIFILKKSNFYAFITCPSETTLLRCKAFHKLLCSFTQLGKGWEATSKDVIWPKIKHLIEVLRVLLNSLQILFEMHNFRVKFSLRKELKNRIELRCNLLRLVSSRLWGLINLNQKFSALTDANHWLELLKIPSRLQANWSWVEATKDCFVDPLHTLPVLLIMLQQHVVWV